MVQAAKERNQAGVPRPRPARVPCLPRRPGNLTNGRNDDAAVQNKAGVCG